MTQIQCPTCYQWGDTSGPSHLCTQGTRCEECSTGVCKHIIQRLVWLQEKLDEAARLAIEQARQEERERCAKIAKETERANVNSSSSDYWNGACREIYHRIEQEPKP